MSPRSLLRFTSADTDDAWRAVQAIRTKVFVEEQACPVDEEFDGLDADAHQVLGFVGDHAIATARWREVEKHGVRYAKLERFAVLAAHRGGGTGRRLVADVIERARAAGHDRFLVHAQAHLQGFYESFGFAAEGERFEEAGIPHVRMTLTDSAHRDHGSR